MTTKLITVYQINNRPANIPMRLVIYQGESLYAKVQGILQTRLGIPIRELYFREGTHPSKQIKS